MTAIASTLGGIQRVNLMPRAEIARRERSTLTRKWMWGVVGAVLVALLIVAGALTLKFLADQRLAAEQARSTQLLAEVSALADVSKALATEQELTEFRAEAMAPDFAWAPVMTALSAALPSGAALTGFDLVSGGAPQTDDPASEVGLTGTVAVTSPDPVDIVAAVRELREVPGVIYADGQSVTSSSVTEGSYSYLLTVTLDQSIYSGEFAIEEGQG
ncbi:PilN domain-containing protein [Microbacterium sp.]|uniref:PilN domain-containing protein n=1 Tax=Microbacterium sp. TaxID=51671 RepID=UPI0035B39A49